MSTRRRRTAGVGESGMSGFFAAHRAMLDRAVETIHPRLLERLSEAPSGKIYGETAKADAEAAFKAQLWASLSSSVRPGEPAGRRRSARPTASPRHHLSGCQVPRPWWRRPGRRRGWAAAGIEERVGVCLEILARLNRQSFLIAKAVMHTTGQAFVMAFQAGGPHAQDRGLEAVAYAFDEMRRVPGDARWEKPQARATCCARQALPDRPARGALAIACATFPTWNSYPGLFASPRHRQLGDRQAASQARPAAGADRPDGREVLEEAGFDPNVLLLAAGHRSGPDHQGRWRPHPEVAIIDFTGSPAFGDWLRRTRKAQVYTEEAGVNSVVLDSTATSRACAATSPSRSRSTPARCARPRRTSSCPRTASRPTRAARAVRRGGGR